MNTGSKNDGGLPLGEALLHYADRALREEYERLTYPPRRRVTIPLLVDPIAHRRPINPRRLEILKEMWWQLSDKIAAGELILVGYNGFADQQWRWLVRYPVDLIKFLEPFDPSPFKSWPFPDPTMVSDTETILIDVRIYPADRVPADAVDPLDAGPDVDGDAEQMPTGAHGGRQSAGAKRRRQHGVTLISSVNECERWFRGLVADGPQKRKKFWYWKEAEKKWPGTLTRNAFNGVWKKVTAGDEGWGKPGPKKRTRIVKR